MKNFLFITDFDGTVTAQDFFIQVLYRYKPKKAFLKSSERGFSLLSEIFNNLNLTETEILNEIKHVAFDFSFFDFVKFIKEKGGEVLVLSAGARYYVENKLKMENLYDDVQIIANDSFYNEKDGGIKLIRNENNRYYDEVFGINKLKIVEFYRDKFKTLAYAGDSYVDFDACRLCDYKFSKGNLSRILNTFHLEHFNFNNFSEVKEFLFDKI